MLSFVGCQNSTALTSLHCPIRSRVEVNFVDVYGFDARRGSRVCSRFVCRYSFHEDVLDSVYVPIPLCCRTRIQYFALAIILSDSGERMHRDKIPPQRMHAAYHIVTRDHVVPSALRSSTATVKAINILVWNSWSRRYPPQMRENLLPVRIIRRQKATTSEDTCTNHSVCCIVGGAFGLE